MLVIINFSGFFHTNKHTHTVREKHTASLFWILSISVFHSLFFALQRSSIHFFFWKQSFTNKLFIQLQIKTHELYNINTKNDCKFFFYIFGVDQLIDWMKWIPSIFIKFHQSICLFSFSSCSHVIIIEYFFFCQNSNLFVCFFYVPTIHNIGQICSSIYHKIVSVYFYYYYCFTYTHTPTYTVFLLFLPLLIYYSFSHKSATF